MVLGDLRIYIDRIDIVLFNFIFRKTQINMLSECMLMALNMCFQVCCLDGDV